MIAANIDHAIFDSLDVLINSVLLEHDSEEFVKVLNLEVFPALMCQHLDESLAIAPIVEHSKDAILKVFQDTKKCWLVLIDLMLITIIVDIVVGFLNDLSTHLLKYGRRSDHEQHGFA